jgi:hypothetical protein
MTSEINLFNNPLVENAKKSMSAEELNRYKILGEEMFSINFACSNALQKDEPVSDDFDFLENCKKNIESSIASGLHISYLSEQEQKFMFDYVGDKWWEKYGFTNLDLNQLYSNF